MKVQLDPADTAFSNLVRTIAKWICQYCFKRFAENDPRLHCSHYIGRDEESTRFEQDNCDALCYICHPYLEGHRRIFDRWKLKQLGELRFSNLIKKANMYCKKDRKLAKLNVERKLKELNIKKTVDYDYYCDPE